MTPFEIEVQNCKTVKDLDKVEQKYCHEIFNNHDLEIIVETQRKNIINHIRHE
jgi:hypothetical protein